MEMGEGVTLVVVFISFTAPWMGHEPIAARSHLYSRSELGNGESPLVPTQWLGQV